MIVSYIYYLMADDKKRIEGSCKSIRGLITKERNKEREAIFTTAFDQNFETNLIKLKIACSRPNVRVY